MATSGDMVRVVNNGDKVFRDGFANRTYEIEPGKAAFVPYDAVTLWFGHPDLFDVSPRQRARTDAFRRLRQRYGAFDTTENDQPVSADAMWERNRPRIEVYTLEGDRLTTIIDDPEGKTVNPASSSQAEHQSLLERLEAVEREAALLRQAAREQSQHAQDQSEEGETGGSGSDGFGSDSTTYEDDDTDTSDAEPLPSSLDPSDDTPDAEPDTPSRPGVRQP